MVALNLMSLSNVVLLGSFLRAGQQLQFSPRNDRKLPGASV